MLDAVYILDRELNTVGIVEEFASCIWTERYSSPGDFEIYCPVNQKMTELFYTNKPQYAVIRDSATIMMIENVLLTTDPENGDRYTVTGRSAEALLDRRVIWEQYKAKDVSVGTVIRSLIEQNVTQPKDPDRKIDLFRSTLVSSSRNMSKLLLVADYYGENLLDAITDLCEKNNIGFRVAMVGEKFQIQLYDGENRTYGQTKNAPIVFSDKFDSLLESRWRKSTKEYKNYILVRGDADYDPEFLDGNALLKAQAQAKEELYHDANQHVTELEEEIHEMQNRLYRLNVRLAELYNIPDSAANQLERDRIEQEIEQVEYSLSLREAALTRAEGNADLYYYYKNLQEKLGDPSRQKMMVCTTPIPVTGIDRREMWVDDSFELEKSNTAIELEAQNENYNEQIEKIWEDYWTTINPSTGVAAGNISETMEEIAYLRSLIAANETRIKAENKKTLDDYYTHLTETGRAALKERSIVSSFDGVVDAGTQYIYGKDFFLGDLVQIRNSWGMEAVVRVTEVMRSRDEAGERIVPTFVTQ